MIAILLGSWLGKLLDETGIAGTLVRKIVEFGGDRPVVVALGVLAVSALVGTVTGSAPAAMLAGHHRHPRDDRRRHPQGDRRRHDPDGHRRRHALRAARLAVLLHRAEPARPHRARLHGEAVPVRPGRRGPLRARRVPPPRRRARLVRSSPSPPKPRSRPASSSATPPGTRCSPRPCPLVLALGFELAIIPSLLAGVLYALVTTTRPREMNKRLLRTLYGGFEVAAAPIALFVAIGILLAAVKLPGAVDALEPLVKAVSPHNAVLFVLVFTAARPALPLPRPAERLRARRGHRRCPHRRRHLPRHRRARPGHLVQPGLRRRRPHQHPDGVGAQYAGVTPQQVMVRTLPYVWAVALGGLCVTAATYL